MGFVVRKQDEDSEFELDVAANRQLFDGDGGEGVEVELGAVDAAWRQLSVLADLEDAEAAVLAQRLAGAWLAPDKDASEMTAEELEDNRALSELYDEAGHEGFVDFLRHFDGTAGTLGAVLATGMFLGRSVADIRSATRYKQREVEGTANELVDLLFEENLEGARALASESLTNLWLSLERTKARNISSRRLRRTASSLQSEAAGLLVALGAEVPEAAKGR